MADPILPTPALDDIPAVFKAGQKAYAQGQLQHAAKLFHSILAAKPDLAEAHFQLARVYQQMQVFSKASVHLTQAAQTRPNEPAIWQIATQVLGQTRNPKLARDLSPLLQTASLPQPVKSGAQQALQRAKSTSKAAAKLIELRLSGNWDSVIEQGMKTLKAHPKDVDVLLETAIAQMQMQANASALKLFQKASRLSPKAIFPILQQGVLLQRLGDMAKADAVLQQVLKLNPAWGETYWLIAVGRKFHNSDPLISQMRMQFDKAAAGPSRMFLGYALGKAMQDIGQTDAVFTFLNVANQEGRKLHPYDVQQRLDEVAALKASFKTASFPQPALCEKKTAPIFVTGMPRSGTTLVEQILAAHPDVVAGGETGILLEAVYQQLHAGGSFKDWGSLTGDQITTIAQQFETRLRARCDFDRIITDKSIQSHLVIGPLLQAIPNAKVVVVHRDPRDVALSCYKNFFPSGTHLYANSLPDLARYIQTFRDMVAFWRTSLPEGAFHEISYDALIQDQEGQTRGLIAACGLDWNDNCLNFHANAGAVGTLSVAQVRQPIYKSSSKGWERYKAELKPFTDILED